MSWRYPLHQILYGSSLCQQQVAGSSMKTRTNIPESPNFPFCFFFCFYSSSPMWHHQPYHVLLPSPSNPSTMSSSEREREREILLSLHFPFFFFFFYWGSVYGFMGFRVYCILPVFTEARFATSLLDRLYFMWLCTSCPDAMADMRESSPARTAPATILASCLEFKPGESLLAPLTPSKFKQADWDASCVPPPTVPTWKVKKHKL